MNSKIKAILSIIILAIIIEGAYFAYTKLSEKYKPQNQINTLEKQVPLETKPQKYPAPDFTVIDTEGNMVKLSDYFGKPIVLNFWASWCPPCKGEMPHFDKAYKEVKNDVVFLMVDLVDGQRETLEKGKKYVQDNGFTFPVLFDTKDDAAVKYGISSIPTTVFINKDGNIVTGFKGAIDEKTLMNSIELIK